MTATTTALYQRFSVSINDVLKCLYGMTTLLCVFMVGWTLFVPGSWLFGRSKFHDEVMAPFYLDYLQERGLVPPEFFTKYEGHTAVHATHLLPAVLWSIIVPFQLHSNFRTVHPKIHRWMGYTLMGCAILIALGLCIILHRGLYFEKSFEDLPPLTFSFEPIIVTNNVYFIVSAIYAVKLARNHQFVSHQRYVIRHVASGLFVALQRIFIAIAFGPFYPPPVSRNDQRIVFGRAGMLGMMFSFSCGEYSIYLLDVQRENNKRQSKK